MSLDQKQELRLLRPLAAVFMVLAALASLAYFLSVQARDALAEELSMLKTTYGIEVETGPLVLTLPPATDGDIAPLMTDTSGRMLCASGDQDLENIRLEIAGLRSELREMRGAIGAVGTAVNVWRTR